MSHPRPLSHISELNTFDALLCDIWGVLHNGRAHFPEAYEALRRFKAERGPVILISNSPRPKSDLITQLQSLGVADDAYSDIVSSGDATRIFLSDYAPKGPAWRIGDPRENNLYAGIDIDLSGTPETAAFISCTSPYDDENDTIERYKDAFEIAAARNLTMICANPDRIVHRGTKLVLCAGSLADYYESFGGKVIMAGKPYAPIYELCYRALDSLSGKPTDKTKILAIGDGIPTDILGANNQDLSVLFIATGIHAQDAIDGEGRLKTDDIAKILDAQSAHATYVSTGLAW